MEDERYTSQNEYSSIIYSLRLKGDMVAAVSVCLDAIDKNRDNNFFYKILGDLYMQSSHFEKASEAYLENLKRLGKRPDQFKSFARFYNRLENKVSNEFLFKYRSSILNAITNGEIAPVVVDQLNIFLGGDFINDPEITELLSLTDNDSNLSRVQSRLEETFGYKNDIIVKLAIMHRIAMPYKISCKHTNSYFIAQAERLNMFDEAMRLLEKSPNLLTDPISICAMLRICRKLEDYEYAETRLTLDKEYINVSKFNVLYELVYYFEYKRNEELMLYSLKKIRNAAESSEPIARTLYNFYLRLNLFDEAKETLERIRELESKKMLSKKMSKDQRTNLSLRMDAIEEAQKALMEQLELRASQLERSRRMTALSDLIKGFAHELGQPITNIRFSAQLYQMKEKKGIISANDMDDLFQLIFSQTERIGKLLDRFAPLVPSKVREENFKVYSRIKDILKNLNIRLDMQGIKHSITGNTLCKVCGDATLFDQIFYNLILNSMQAFDSINQPGGNIEISIIYTPKHPIQISYSDNGPGIPASNAEKIFEPFFSTKPPSTEDGGNGLGLFIVWNILKMFGGSISLNKGHSPGARFDIIIPIKEEYNEQSLNHRR